MLSLWQLNLEELIQQGLDVEWSNRCHAVVDGRGVQRVCEALTKDVDTDVKVRHTR